MIRGDEMRVPLVGVIKGCKWALSATQLSVLSCYRSADSIYITFVAKRMMRMRMVSTTTPIIIIILMFFHQYFLATLVDVLWNESAWKTKQGNPNKQTENEYKSLWAGSNCCSCYIAGIGWKHATELDKRKVLHVIMGYRVGKSKTIRK